MEAGGRRERVVERKEEEKGKMEEDERKEAIENKERKETKKMAKTVSGRGIGSAEEVQ